MVSGDQAAQRPCGRSGQPPRADSQGRSDNRLEHQARARSSSCSVGERSAGSRSNLWAISGFNLVGRLRLKDGFEPWPGWPASRHV